MLKANTSINASVLFSNYKNVAVDFFQSQNAVKHLLYFYDSQTLTKVMYKI